MNRYAKAARLIASKLTKEEFVDLHELWDGDAKNSLFSAIARETNRAAPELFVPPPGPKWRLPQCPKKCGQPAEKAHACPYRIEIGDDDVTKCRCCADCQNACAADV